jgi:hypothetical protein
MNSMGEDLLTLKEGIDAKVDRTSFPLFLGELIKYLMKDGRYSTEREEHLCICCKAD